MARDSMFGDLSGGKRLQGVISKRAAKRFETHRRNLAAMAATIGWNKAVSDAAVIEYLALGLEQTVKFFKKKQK